MYSDSHNVCLFYNEAMFIYFLDVLFVAHQCVISVRNGIKATLTLPLDLLNSDNLTGNNIVFCYPND
jgi:hypothetical protein